MSVDPLARSSEEQIPEEAPEPPRPAAHGKRWALEWLLVLVVAIGVAVLIRTYVAQTFYIPSGSMEPTLMIGDKILVDKLSFHFESIARGDIVVFKRPPLETDTEDADLVKRIVGLPGEFISSGPNGEVLINGKPIPEPYLTKQAREDPGPPIRPQRIPKGDYFVMGDNRGDSSDSRVFGPIPGSLIVGGARFRIWPLSRIGGI